MSDGEQQPEWMRHVEWITILGQNIMAAANDLRPIQARGNLELMMKRQLELRREETKAIHEKCDNLEAMLEDMRKSTHDSSDNSVANISDSLASVTNALVTSMGNTKGKAVDRSAVDTKTLTDEDVFRWAEEIG
ncbi:hypothetical protein QCA50_002174 [Cerrena zonata]|uniref:Mediator of RNA polymerase II transcription subunit 7 n=1 Tax=Cerrena zonata TaxID=2478898 RepID=A0AAW0GNC3_9APHY